MPLDKSCRVEYNHYMIELKLYVPEYQKEGEVTSPLIAVADKLGLKTEVIRFTEEEGDKLKLGTMLPVSVSKKIGIKQTRRTKSLYTQLLVLINGSLFTFYPQRYSEKEISIEKFLEGLLNGEILCLHDSDELKREIFVK